MGWILRWLWQLISEADTATTVAEWIGLLLEKIGWKTEVLAAVSAIVTTATTAYQGAPLWAYELAGIGMGLIVVTFSAIFQLPTATIPAVRLLAPTQTYHLRWAPLIEFHPYMVPEPQAWQSAVNQQIHFGLKNLGTSPAQDIHVEWAFEAGGNTLEMILRSPYTHRFSPRVNGELVTFSRGNYTLALALKDREVQTLPYLIASSTSSHVDELAMPEQFSRAFKMRVVVLQDRIMQSVPLLLPSKREPGPTVSVVLSWGASQNRMTLRYRVRSEVTVLPNDVGAPGLLNISPQHQAPENLRAYVTFGVQSID